MKFYEVIVMVWIALAVVWILGNVFISYQYGVTYNGEPDHDHYREARP